MKNNPYVGPRPYERDDRHFYGREREERDLLSLILAEPVLLFYAASSADKAPLLNATIVPGLEAPGSRPPVLAFHQLHEPSITRRERCLPGDAYRPSALTYPCPRSEALRTVRRVTRCLNHSLS